MRILVAGGCGYVGSMVVPALLDRGHDVQVVDLGWFGLDSPAPVSQMDLFTMKDIDADQVIFLGGLSNDPMAENDPAANFRYNAALPAYLAYISKQAGVKRFIYASSCSIYGYLESELSTEEHNPNCHFPYGISKYLGERGCLQVQGDEFSVIGLRKGTIGGHSPRMRFDLIVNTMTRSALTKGVVTVDNPALWRPLLDIRSAVSAYMRAVEAAPEISGAFNIADDNYTVGSVADIVADTVSKATGRHVGVVQTESGPESQGRTKAALRNYKVDCWRAKNLIGWRPQYTVADTVNEIVNRWRGGEYGNNLYDSRFSNIETWKQVSPTT